MNARALSILAACCLLAGCSSTTAGPCQDLLRCCETIEAQSAALGSQCRASHDQYRGTEGADEACAGALSTLSASGACAGPKDNDGGVLDRGGDDGGGQSSEVCEAYLTCVSLTTPEGLATIAASYGKGGVCWRTLTPAACEQACLTGLRNVQKVHPDQSACPICFSDLDCQGSSGGPACDQGRCVLCSADAHCSGATPACDSGTHACVECTRPEHCSHGGCDLASHTCTECLKDAECLSPTAPRCLVSAQKCVECTSSADCTSADRPACLPGIQRCGCAADAQCASKRCDLASARCCTPASCPAGYCGWMLDSGCGGARDCGPCVVGTCIPSVYYPQGPGGSCSNLKAPCKAESDCAPIERCLYSPKQQSYFCVKDAEGKQCLGIYGDSDCTTLAGSVDAFKCLVSSGAFGKCTPWCLTATECASGQTSGQTCHPASGAISPASPGLCY